MKIKGINRVEPKPVPIVIPRSDAEPVVFTAKAVLNWDDFDRLCPEPQPPKIVRAGGDVNAPEFNTKDPKYLESIVSHGRKRISWIILESLSATESLEWETVKMDDSETWAGWRKELENFGLSPAEISHIYLEVMKVNALTDGLLEQARERFLAGNAPQNKE